ncbi:activity-regulated cytoskeleton-associated protein-like [Diabrotica undecimpunctata]|uniref:activity-regulated cytoskeleton-associated protein-like n=1 Tax=Diabrotica undecimpunctata TaxID=50387 RepID=UPI003B63F5D9
MTALSTTQGTTPQMPQPEPLKPRITYVKPPQFSGRDTENPLNFLTKAENFLIKHKVDEDQWIDYLIDNSLHGDAKKWAQKFSYTDLPYTTFRDRLLRRYNDPAAISTLTSKLHGEHQRRDESTEEFINQKSALFRRLMPHTPEDQRCITIANLLRPDIAICLRANIPRTEEDLLTIAQGMECDIRRTGKPQQQQQQQQPYRPLRQDNAPRHPEAIDQWRNPSGQSEIEENLLQEFTMVDDADHRTLTPPDGRDEGTTAQPTAKDEQG